MATVSKHDREEERKCDDSKQSWNRQKNNLTRVSSKIKSG